MGTEPKVIRQVVSQGKCTGVVDVTFGRSDQGTEQMGLVFDVTKGEYEGRRLPWYGTLDSDKALALVKETLVNAGWDGESSMTELTGLGSRVVNLAIDVLAIERNGETYPMPKLRFVNRLAQATMKNPIEGEDRKTFLAALDDRIRRVEVRPKGNSAAARSMSPEEAAALAEQNG